MSYIGNNPDVNAFTVGVDKFNGTGACTQFTLTRSISDVNAIQVVVNGVQQETTAAYTVSNGVITFTEAPSSGTNNIIVTYLAPVVVTFNQVTSTQLQANSVTQTALADNSITRNKISNLSISGDKLELYSVSGNNIGTGAISANNFAGGGITSNVLASNLSISLTRVLESANINGIAIGGTVNIDIANNTAYFFNANTTANVTFNLRANTQNTFDSITTTGQTATVAIAVRNGANRYTANLSIDGVLQAPFFVANTRPRFQSISNQEINVFGYTVFKTAANAYTVLASNTLFGLS